MSLVRTLVSTRVTLAPSYQEERSSLSFDMVTFLGELGCLPILVPCNTKALPELFRAVSPDAIVLSGGNNVSGFQLDDVHPERDILETGMIRMALEYEIPILGICRGFHFLNLQFGGSLICGIPNHVATHHTLLGDWLDGESVNSYHNHGIRTEHLSDQLHPLCQSEDGFVEAFYHKNEEILGVQWHPERNRPQPGTKTLQRFLRGEPCVQLF